MDPGSLQLVGIQVGRPRDLEWRGQRLRTAIVKTAVAGRVRVGRLNLAGDEQADPSVHGGPDKAVYAYPAEHYAAWRAELSDADLTWGAFGENLTTRGLLESDVCIGDRLRIGTAEFRVTQPRMPCSKLAARFGRADMVKIFLDSRRSGFYLAVAREGDIAAGDRIEIVARDERGLTVAQVAALYTDDEPERALLERAALHPILPQSWRERFRKRL